ncbi:MAG TPA: pilus assembly protein TadG-related protein [Gemmatimonadales bacterium]|nr:pilus assembly protein TadG-related protein [Gemmatimonadales bacterium]
MYPGRSASSKAARKNERGVALVMMALMVFLILGVSAMVVDYGMIKAAKAEAQRAMDAAALAGASAFLIPDPETDYESIAKERAHEFAHKHSVQTVPITAGEDSVTVNVAAKTVKVDWYRSNLPLWFANVFGSSSIGLSASATARASESGVANCLKPVALPDMWNNVNNVTTGPGKKTSTEDVNGDHVWDYVDANSNGVLDPGEMEPWTFNTGDIYDPPTTGYGTTYRNTSGTGYTVKTKDYGRQIFVQAFDPKDALVESYFRTWAENESTRGTDSMAASIRGERCTEGAVGTEYRQGNGAKEPLGDAWEYLINQDPSAHWNDATNDVDGSSYGTDWLDKSPRVVTVGLYDPQYASAPQDNPIEFTNFAKLWVDQRPCVGPGACKNPITARFLGYVEGGAGGPTTGTLIYHLVLIK